MGGSKNDQKGHISFSLFYLSKVNANKYDRKSGKMSKD
jgi:hypothetical protein